MASSRRAAALQDNSEMCPVCKSSSYLNKNLRFMVNPECYHRMCTSCVDRIFGPGPAPCPVAGCGKTLRKNRFKEPRFSDLAIERECDIRARVEAVLNNKESDFDSLRAFNDFQEEKEVLIMDLVAGTNVAEIEKKLKEHAARHKEKIKANAVHEQDLRRQVEDDEQTRIERSRLMRAEAQREFYEEKAEREAGHREVVDRIASSKGSDVHRVVKEVERANQERAAKRLKTLETSSSIRGGLGEVTSTNNSNSTRNTTSDTGGFEFAGMKKVQPKVKEVLGPYDPFDGMLVKFQYHTLAERYDHRTNEECDNRGYACGGYLARDFQQRCILDAHAGLGVFVDEEKA